MRQLPDTTAKSPDQWADTSPADPGVLLRDPDDVDWSDNPVRAFNRHLSNTRCVTGWVDGHGDTVAVGTLGFQYYSGPQTGQPDPRWLWPRLRQAKTPNFKIQHSEKLQTPSTEDFRRFRHTP